MSTSHTPGPWTVEPFRFGGIPQGHLVIGSKSGTGADTFLSVVFSGTKDVTVEEATANARLIAAAPELLEACKVLLAVIDNPKASIPDSNLNKKRYKALAAIERAEGSASPL